MKRIAALLCSATVAAAFVGTPGHIGGSTARASAAYARLPGAVPRTARRARAALAPGQPGFARLAATAASAGPATEHALLKDVRVRRVSGDEECAVVNSQGRQLVLLLTHFGDLSSWEYAQQVRHSLPALLEQGVEVKAVGIGGRDAAKRFAALVGFPEEHLYYDPEAACCAALDCDPGFGRDAVTSPQNNAASPYLRLLPMLLGIGSPGTLGKVIYGYFGDRTYNPQWLRAQLARTATDSFPYVSPDMFDKVPTYPRAASLRPFELATLRLQNMIGILENWGELIPANADLVVQQGASLLLDGEETAYAHRDTGILNYGGQSGVKSIQDLLALALK